MAEANIKIIKMIATAALVLRAQLEGKIASCFFPPNLFASFLLVASHLNIIEIQKFDPLELKRYRFWHGQSITKES